MQESHAAATEEPAVSTEPASEATPAEETPKDAAQDEAKPVSRYRPFSLMLFKYSIIGWGVLQEGGCSEESHSSCQAACSFQEW